MKSEQLKQGVNEYLFHLLNKGIFALLLTHIEINRHIKPIATTISKLVRGYGHKDDYDIFKYEDENRISIDAYGKKGTDAPDTLIVYRPPNEKRSRSTHSGYLLALENGQPIDFSIINTKKGETIYIKDGKLTETGKKEPILTMILFADYLRYTLNSVAHDMYVKNKNSRSS